MGFRRKNKKKLGKLNLIPILDSVFIFIFFLLMSAQFIDIYEIGTDAPIVQSVPQDKKEKDPLNLILEIKTSHIIVKTGLAEKVYTKLEVDLEGEYPYDMLKNKLVGLKQKHPEESTVIFRPESRVKYQKIVKLMDAIRRVEDELREPSGKTEASNVKNLLFDQVVFENLQN